MHVSQREVRPCACYPTDPTARSREVQLDGGARLAWLWKAFERSGEVSAYIAYRFELAHLARYPTGSEVWLSDDRA